MCPPLRWRIRGLFFHMRPLSFLSQRVAAGGRTVRRALRARGRALRVRRRRGGPPRRDAARPTRRDARARGRASLGVLTPKRSLSSRSRERERAKRVVLVRECVLCGTQSRRRRALPRRRHAPTQERKTSRRRLLFLERKGAVIESHFLRSGAGKSSVLALLLRLYEASEGRVVVNGVDVRAMDGGAVAALRAREFAVVEQGAPVFAGTALSAVCYPARDDAASARAACELADAHGFVTSQLKDGYNSSVGCGGAALSGGQRQRLAVARALRRRDCAALVLDEPTAALDAESEQRVLDAIFADVQSRGATLLIVAHSTARTLASPFLTLWSCTFPSSSKTSSCLFFFFFFFFFLVRAGLAQKLHTLSRALSLSLLLLPLRRGGRPLSGSLAFSSEGSSTFRPPSSAATPSRCSATDKSSRPAAPRRSSPTPTHSSAKPSSPRSSSRPIRSLSRSKLRKRERERETHAHAHTHFGEAYKTHPLRPTVVTNREHRHHLR